MKVAFNGLGRIGRIALLKLLKDPAAEIVAINEMTDAKTIAYMLKYDSVHSIFAEVEAVEDALCIDGRRIPVLNESDITKLPWKELGAELVVDCTGRQKKRVNAEKHIEAGAKMVVCTYPCDNDVRVVVYNVNHETIRKEDCVVSAASCTTNCSSLLLATLSEGFPMAYAQITSIHAVTKDQTLLDSIHPGGKMRRGRAAFMNIVPTTTNADALVERIVPKVRGKLTTVAQRVPVIAGSLVLLSFLVPDRDVTVEEVNACAKNAKNESLGYTEDELVSSDILDCPYGAMFDATQTQVFRNALGTLVSVAGWYDNECSYASQATRVVQYMMKERTLKNYD